MCYVSLRSHVRRQLPAGEQAAPSQAATCLSVLREGGEEALCRPPWWGLVLFPLFIFPD